MDMKRKNLVIGLLFCLLKVNAQTQMLDWYTGNGKIYNWTTSATSNFFTGGTIPASVANGIGDAASSTKIAVFNTMPAGGGPSVFNGTQSPILTIAPLEFTAEYDIAPYPCDLNRYYIFYPEVGPLIQVPLRVAKVDLTGTNPNTDAVLKNYMGTQRIGLALSKIRQGGSRYLYVFGKGIDLERFEILPNGTITAPVQVIGQNVITNALPVNIINEMDLSHDGTQIGIVCRQAIMLIKLSTSGAYVSHQFITTTDFTQGGEFSSDGSKFYYSYADGGANSGIAYVNTTTFAITQVTGSAGYGKSNIELSRDGYMRAANGTTLIAINESTGAVVSGQSIALTLNQFNNGDGFYIYTLPDQIDGFDYAELYTPAVGVSITGNDFYCNGQTI